ncbi:MAG: chemotaxis protein CheD, partial [Lachnospiraceae bacterium]|nr:chemotaxis protein CheD [Lachnospiraceae bacterium]
VKQMVAAGANRNRLEAKIAGGAKMFSFSSKTEMVTVGERNAEASKKKLAEMKIKLLAEDTGDSYGRTVIFYPETGAYVIKAVGKPEKTI